MAAHKFLYFTGSMSSLSSLSPSQYGDALFHAFSEASRTAGLTRRWYAVGGRSLCVEFAGDALVPLLAPALEHLAAQPGSSALTISVWDTHSTGVVPPAATWTENDLLPRNEIRGYTDEPIRLTWHPDPSVISFIDSEANRAFFWIDDTRHTPYYECGSPFRSILHWWAAGHNRQLVHAAAVGPANGGVLIAGKGGSGKSNTALACIGKLPYAADDYCVVEGGQQPFVYSLYNTAKVGGDDMALYPHLADAVGNAEKTADEKALLYLHRYRPQDITTGFPLRAVLVPRRTGLRETSITDASSVAALQALAPSTIFQLPGAGDATFRFLADVCKRVPCYFLNLGTDRSAIAGAIADVPGVH